MRRWVPSEHDEFWFLKVVMVVAVIALAIMGIIEFSARRQAAASVREWTRPMNPSEQAKFDALLREEQRKSDEDVRRVRAEVWAPEPRRRVYVPPAPLQDGERCISGQRFRRVENGWVQIGVC